MSRIRRNAAILNKVYPVGTVYIDANNAATCPIAAVMSGSTWTKIGTKLLTEASEAPVVGNGKTLGLIDSVGADVYAMGTNSQGLIRANYADIGTTSVLAATSKVLGVTTESDKSGLVAKLGESTGLEVTLWKRTK